MKKTCFSDESNFYELFDSQEPLTEEEEEVEWLEKEALLDVLTEEESEFILMQKIAGKWVWGKWGENEEEWREITGERYLSIGLDRNLCRNNPGKVPPNHAVRFFDDYKEQKNPGTDPLYNPENTFEYNFVLEQKLKNWSGGVLHEVRKDWEAYKLEHCKKRNGRRFGISGPVPKIVLIKFILDSHKIRRS